METDVYMVSIYGEGFDFVGHPADAPWEKLDDKDVCAHNASFDEMVYYCLVERKIVPFVLLRWHCTADACATNQLPRSLKDASAVLYDIKVDKSVRDKMKGVRYEKMSVAEQTEVVEYARNDAKLCLRIAEDLFPEISVFEKALSTHTRYMGYRGVPIDLERVEEYISILRGKLWECDREIPWANSLNAKGKPTPITSPIALAKACKDAGIPAPVTTAKSDARFDEWAEEYKGQIPFVAAVQRHRALNRALNVLTSMQNRVDGDGRMSYGLKYYGAAATGRWSGDSGLNLQNLPREPIEGVDIRSVIKAPDRKKLIVLDFSQIEARVAMLMGKNEPLLKQLAEGVDLYEAYARTMLGYTDPEPLKTKNPALRHKAKTMGLGLQFGLGAETFALMSKMAKEEAYELVCLFKRTNPGICRQWEGHRKSFIEEVRRNSPIFVIRLPSGRMIRYFKPQCSREEGLKASTIKGGPRRGWYGGKLFQNSVQSIARDILADAILRLEEQDLNVILHVHDEVILEVDADKADECFTKAVEIMSTPPAWLPKIPLAVEGHILERYEK
jgi:DNA polymerase